MKLLKNITYILFLSLLWANITFAQKKTDNPTLKIYRATATKINNLIHTKLDVRFDYKKQYLYGKAWITLKPYIYPTDSLTLDAKGMDIKTVAVVKTGKNIPLKYSYDSLLLKINLDKTYNSTDSYTIFVNYTAKPNELKTKGSQAITDAKGLYFINPDSTQKGKPVQIWTQGETEASSVWFPTIDKPNQKTTQEITLTVPSKYITLSNGAIISQKKNPDGTRSDTWKMDKPHAPYLFMMAVGNFKVYHDKWKNIPVDYYLEPEYAPYAKDIFGLTPEMIGFFSSKLGIDYPWNKYAQIAVRDYVSGAMENTTATLHGDFVHQTKRELIDGSAGEDVIAHELFHQWFGDYVTAESWSNLSVNESFADLSETLWLEYKHGKDAGDEHNFEAMQAYLNSAQAKTKNLIRFYYADKEEVFDVVTYQKGGRILNMLRTYLGNTVFYKGLNHYLTQNALGNGEAHQLRLAFEKASGKDLNWFFNQWYYSPGHPDLKITYKWDDASKTQTVYLAQTQDEEAFKLPMKIDVYVAGKKQTHPYFMTSKLDSVVLKLSAKPDLVNIDADKILLATKKDDKTIEQFAFQYANAPQYLDRLEALKAASTKLGNTFAQKILMLALADKYEGLRLAAIQAIDLENPEIKNATLPILIDMAKNDNKTKVKAAALEVLASLNDVAYIELFNNAIKEQSYAVQSAGLKGIAELDIDAAFKLAKKLENESKGALSNTISSIYANKGDENNFEFVNKAFEKAGVQQKFNTVGAFATMLGKINDVQNFKTGLNQIKKFTIDNKKYGIGAFMQNIFNSILKTKTENITTSAVTNDNLKAQIEYLKSTIEATK
ncbi:MAG: M1 family peptidase [Sphingobacteriales bacterium]|nr:MAG: M1 family peptidase [Sphingobacteriales bacterium]TAF80912.1 MAG: M1 family peptidase [Sphingobacteriales bacterium]